jgi:hypothetical protein
MEDFIELHEHGVSEKVAKMFFDGGKDFTDVDDLIDFADLM